MLRQGNLAGARHVVSDLRQIRFVLFELRPIEVIEAQISGEQENEGNGNDLNCAA